MADTARMASAIHDHMPVIGSDGRHLGVVDRVEGRYLKLTASDPAAGGVHRFLPVSTVAVVEGGLVRLGVPAAQAGEACLNAGELEQRLALGPDARAAFGRPDDDRRHGSRAHAHGGPKGQREHGQSGQAPGPPGQTSFGVDRRM
jgi:hypothetical protein